MVNRDVQRANQSLDLRTQTPDRSNVFTMDASEGRLETIQEIHTIEDKKQSSRYWQAEDDAMLSRLNVEIESEDQVDCSRQIPSESKSM